jgi:exosortase A-associated hydrolase 1
MAGPATSTWREEVLSFECDGDRLLGILTRPTAAAEIGLVIVPGGSQYRVGAHRQNVLLARSLADRRIATLRFDARGMGDSAGTHPGFTAFGPDIEAAVSALRSAVPGLDRTILCGLCDGASAIALGLPTGTADGAILLNPWARSDKTLAAAQIRTHYPRRILSATFWKKLLTGRINPWAKAGEIRAALVRSRQVDDGGSLADRLYRALSSSNRPVLLVLAGRDMTAAEFEGAVLHRLQDRPPAHLTILRVVGADHTFSGTACWRVASEQIGDWLVQRPLDRMRDRETETCR